MFEFTPKPNILQHFVNRKFERGSYTYLREKRLSFFFYFLNIPGWSKICYLWYESL